MFRMFRGHHIDLRHRVSSGDDMPVTWPRGHACGRESNSVVFPLPRCSPRSTSPTQGSSTSAPGGSVTDGQTTTKAAICRKDMRVITIIDGRSIEVIDGKSSIR